MPMENRRLDARAGRVYSMRDQASSTDSTACQIDGDSVAARSAAIRALGRVFMVIWSAPAINPMPTQDFHAHS
jgi:hypothetical protein